MQLCTSCKKATATVHILDLQNGSVAEQRHYCTGCAEGAGLIQQKMPPLKLGAAEMLDLIGNIKLHEPETGRRKGGVACPACGLTVGEFKVRGRMGCPRCYEVFRSALLPLLERVHEATAHRGRVPGRTAPPKPSQPADILADLRQKLAAAIEHEKYEEAAALRDRIKGLEEQAGDKPS